MEADMMSMLIDLSRHSPHLLGSLDLAAVAADTDSLLMDSFGSMYDVPAGHELSALLPPPSPEKEYEYDDSLSGLYACSQSSRRRRYDDPSSPDVVNSCSTAAAAAAAAAAVAAASSKNIAMERDRRKRLNEKLYALRAVVPKISKVTTRVESNRSISCSQLNQFAAHRSIELESFNHAEERRLLEEISALESTVATKSAAGAGDDDDGVPLLPRMKKPRTTPPPHDGASMAASPPLQILQLQVSKVGERTMAVSIRCARTRDAMVKVCRAMEALRLKVVSANVAAVDGSIVHTMFVQTEEMGGAHEMQQRIQTSLLSSSLM
ncbi:transcription factor BHLH6-like isoform X1 [Oryza brachyantha]|uniref:transcription factor BHLH6-like isoform X1 n=1 Tax=Oryza brachyantha TaxID=4533 RepID=UPI001ADCA0CB|nr:transcription factor BHLH6-like isoform X1 [Oryza brachyantha]